MLQNKLYSVNASSPAPAPAPAFATTFYCLCLWFGYSGALSKHLMWTEAQVLSFLRLISLNVLISMFITFACCVGMSELLKDESDPLDGHPPFANPFCQWTPGCSHLWLLWKCRYEPGTGVCLSPCVQCPWVYTRCDSLGHVVIPRVTKKEKLKRISDLPKDSTVRKWPNQNITRVNLTELQWFFPFSC